MIKVKKRYLICAATTGFIAGYLTKQETDRFKVLSPEKALAKAKETFGAHGPINGSWIYMNSEALNHNGLRYTVYHGGVTRNMNGKNVPYEFDIDKVTGTIINAYAVQ